MRRIMLVGLLSGVGLSGCMPGPKHFQMFYQPYLTVPLPPYQGHTESIIGHPGRIPELSTEMNEADGIPLRQAQVFNEIRQELTRQLRDGDYALIGWMAGVGGCNASYVELEEAMAREAKRRGGDTVLIVSQRVQGRVPFVYLLSGYPRTMFYGETDQPTHVAAFVHGGLLKFPQAEAFVLRSCPGIDEQMDRVLSLRPAEWEAFEGRWGALETEAGPLPSRSLLSRSSSTWSYFAQQRSPWKGVPRGDIDERLIIEDSVIRQITGETPSTQWRGRFWRGTGPVEAVE